jgi:hypothetical protein
LHPKYKGRDQAHCYAATEAVYHLLGGPASAYRPKQLTLGPETSHWWLEGPNGEIVDPTHDQFEEPIDYTLGTGKGFLTREPSKRANEIIQRVMKTSMALRPEDFTKLPETLYHVAQRDDLGNIMVEGLRPASELGRSRDVGFFAPRPGHVYMYTDISEAMDSGRWNEEEIGWDDEGNEVDVRRNDPVMLAINKNLLDPAKFKADEDYLFHRDHLYDYGEAPQSYPKERQMGYNSLGEWAQEKGLDDPQVTWDSAQNNYTLAYEGTIPPDAITILDHLQQDQEFATL